VPPTNTPAPPGVPQVDIDKTADPTVAGVGDVVTFTLVVTNTGRAAPTTPTLTPTRSPTATATTGQVNVALSKTVGCETVGQVSGEGVVAGRVSLTVNGGPISVTTYEDRIEYLDPSASSDSSWVGVTTTVLSPELRLPLNLGPGTHEVTYTIRYNGVPAGAQDIRNVLVVHFTGVPGEASSSIQFTTDPIRPCSVGSTSTPTATIIASATGTAVATPTPTAPATASPTAPATASPTAPATPPAPEASAVPTAAAAPTTAATAPAEEAAAEEAAAEEAAAWADAQPLAIRIFAPARQDGGVTLVEVEVVDQLPPGLEFVSASDGGTYDPATRQIRWSIGPLAPGASRTLTYTARVTQAGTWVNTACVDGRDEAGNEVRDCDDATVTPPEPTATPTPARTPTVTVGPGTPSPTPGPTDTPAPSPTVTLVPSATATSSGGGNGGGGPAPTFTPTPTATASPSPSVTPEPTPTQTPTQTPTPTPTSPPTGVLPGPPVAPPVPTVPIETAVAIQTAVAQGTPVPPAVQTQVAITPVPGRPGLPGTGGATPPSSGAAAAALAAAAGALVALRRRSSR
jgi:hypothetical protein